MEAAKSTSSDAQWRVLIVCPTPHLASELVDLLGREAPLTQAIEWKSYPTTAELAKLMNAVPLDVCFLDMGSDPARAFELLASRGELPGSLPVVALLSNDSPDFILRCLRQGACAFLLRPLSPDQLGPALQRVGNLLPGRRDAPAPTGEVYCVIPASGASGATTVAANLAYHAKRLGAGKVLLADLDPLTSPLSFLLKLKSPYSFVDALLNSGRLDQDLWKGLVIFHEGVDVLLSPDSPADGTVESHDATSIVEYARCHYDVIVLDVGAAYGHWSTSLARQSDQLLLVTTNEVQSLYCAQRVIAYLARNGVDRDKIRVVLNRHRRDMGLDVEDVATALGTDVFHRVPVDRQALEAAMMEGRPAPADSEFGKSLAVLAARLSGREAAEGKSSPRKGLLSLFSRT